MINARIVPLGENAFIVRLSNKLDREVNSTVRALSDAVRAAALPDVIDVVAANSSVGVYFERADSSVAIVGALEKLLREAELIHPSAAQTLHEIPVWYDGADLSAVAVATGLPADEVVEIHAAGAYQVFAIGFVPGFAYMGEVDERLSVPRRANPRTAVPAGSVAIANRQTAIYPFETPGGWNIIGRTSVLPFEIECDPPALFRVGDQVKFVPQ